MSTSASTRNTYEERLGTDPMFRLVLKMSLPSVAAQMVMLLYNIVDRIYIGHIAGIGTDALAGVGVTTSMVILISAFSSIVGAGGAPLAAMALGSGDRQRAGKILGNGVTLLMLFTLLTASVSYIYMEPILLATGASEKTLPYAMDYFSIYLIGTLFVQITTGLNTFINAQGRPAIAMWSVTIGAMLNIILDPIFIFGLDLGVAGAAWATVISQAAGAIWILRFLTSGKASLRIERRYLRLEGNIVLPVIGLGMAPFIMASTESLIGFVLNGQLQIYGDIYVSALAIMQTAMQFVTCPLNGIAQGFIPIVSYNYGHGDPGRVRQCFRIVMTLMFSINFILNLIMILFPSLTARIFTSDEQLITVVHDYLPLFFTGMTIFGLQRACQNMFVALGQSRISIFIALLRKVILLVPLALILPHFLNVTGVFAAEAISDATAAIICTLIFAYTFPRILRKIQPR